MNLKVFFIFILANIHATSAHIVPPSGGDPENVDLLSNSQVHEVDYNHRFPTDERRVLSTGTSTEKLTDINEHLYMDTVVLKRSSVCTSSTENDFSQSRLIKDITSVLKCKNLCLRNPGEKCSAFQYKSKTNECILMFSPAKAVKLKEIGYTVWCGLVKKATSEIINKSVSVSSFPNNVARSLSTNILHTRSNGRFALYPGTMFDVIASKDITIENMWLNIYRTNTITIEIYTKLNSHLGFDKDPDSWTLIGSSRFRGYGNFEPKSLANGAFTSQEIKAGQTRAFYVTATEPYDFKILTVRGYDYGTGVWASNNDIKIMEGCGKNYPFLTSFGTTQVGGRSAKFSGALVYRTLDTEPSQTRQPSNEPERVTVHPTNAPTSEIEEQTENDNQWLLAHNKRRYKYHTNYGKRYVSLKWSNDLARSAQSYAEKLIAISGCRLEHGYQGDKYGGENLAANSGSSPQNPEQVLQRWTENEEPNGSFSFSESGHFTQVLWRASHYLGCGQASKSRCHIQVCRYLRPGNCNIRSWNWEDVTFADTSRCGPYCPKDGCDDSSSSSNTPPSPIISNFPSSLPSQNDDSNQDPPKRSEFNIALMNMGTELRFDRAFQNAKEKWETIIVGDLPDVPAKASSMHSWFGSSYWNKRVNVNIDDVLIGYDIGSIDGEGDVLGYAGPIHRRTGSSITAISGIMKFDRDDFDSMSYQDIELVILHEMGHVLGIGSFFDNRCGINCRSGDTRYTCSRAKEEYNNLNLGDTLRLQEGACGHWAESNFQHNTKSELMTPYFEYQRYQPISRVTVGALFDLGYIVDFSKADPWEKESEGANYLLSAPDDTLVPSKTFTLNETNILRPELLIDEEM